MGFMGLARIQPWYSYLKNGQLTSWWKTWKVETRIILGQHISTLPWIFLDGSKRTMKIFINLLSELKHSIHLTYLFTKIGHTQGPTHHIFLYSHGKYDERLDSRWVAIVKKKKNLCRGMYVLIGITWKPQDGLVWISSHLWNMVGRGGGEGYNNKPYTHGNGCF